MDLRPIQNKEEYTNALREIERLWDSQIGSPEGDRMNALVDLVVAYDDIHYPCPLIDDPAADESEHQTN